jgi:iron complex outermembrane receptor protein
MCGTNTTSINKVLSRLALGSAAYLAISFAGPSFAQDSDSGQVVLDEIIITAQKREQSLQDVPAAVSAISGETVRDYLGSAENVRALANRVPSLNIESSNGRTQPRLYIRGMGNIDFDNNASQPVGMVFDEIFLENNVLRSLPLFDIERVEVLKGPQGSLFGRNTNAGIVKIDSVKPTFDSDGYVSFAYGDRDTVAAEAAFSGPVADGVAARLSLKYQTRSDWIDNAAAGTTGDDFGSFDELAYRLQFLIEPGDDFRGLLKFHGFEQEGSQPQVFYANAIEAGKKGLRKGFDEKVANHDGAPLCEALNDRKPACAGMDLDHFGFAANLQWDLGDVTFTSITGYDSVTNFQSTDVDGGVLDFNIGALGSAGFFSSATGDGLDDHEQFTQEMRLSGDGDSTFWQVGLYYISDDIDIKTVDFIGCCGNPGASDIVSQNTESVAAFGQVEFSVSDQFAITAGLRYTTDDKELRVKPGPTSVSPADTIVVDDSFMSWDLAFTYDMSEDWTWYGRYANASRGPVTLGRFGFTSSADTETTDSVEFGFKSTLADGRARLNASVYRFVNDDQQLTATGGVGNANRLLNADMVEGEGLEVDFEALMTDNFMVMFNASYNHTEIDDPNLLDELAGAAPSVTPLDPIIDTTRIGGFGFPVTDVSVDGNPLPRTPEWTYNLILQYSIPLDDGEFYVNTDWNYRDDANLFLHETVEFVAESRVLGGLRIGYRTEKVDMALVGRNITDELTVDGGINFNNLTAFINEPAYWGVEFRRDF